jgi:2-hydroxycyclohexanecarboxyl-CoA dehydrogenase
MQNLLDMKGRVALVTGAGQGIGRQIALHLAGHGADVIVNDFFLDRAETVAKEVDAAGGHALALQADVSDFESVRALVSAGAQEFGTINVLVNNAGNMGPVKPDGAAIKAFWETGPEDWSPWLAVNLYGVLNCTRHVLAGMVEAGAGSIISIISEASRYGDPGLEVYAGAKAAAAGVMRSVARDAARYGVRANSVAIGGTRTASTEAAWANPDVAKKFLRLYPLRRPAEPTDVANMVLFLASDAASYVTGQVYAVNGGFLFSL